MNWCAIMSNVQLLRWNGAFYSFMYTLLAVIQRDKIHFVKGARIFRRGIVNVFILWQRKRTDVKPWATCSPCWTQGSFQRVQQCCAYLAFMMYYGVETYQITLPRKQKDEKQGSLQVSVTRARLTSRGRYTGKQRAKLGPQKAQVPPLCQGFWKRNIHATLTLPTPTPFAMGSNANFGITFGWLSDKDYHWGFNGFRASDVEEDRGFPRVCVQGSVSPEVCGQNRPPGGGDVLGCTNQSPGGLHGKSGVSCHQAKQWKRFFSGTDI